MTLWPIAVEKVDYLQDKGAMNAAGLDRPDAEAAVRFTLNPRRSGVIGGPVA